jgi:L-ascorbate metabolism protein UlaG (beta-lactamase superfamily)
VVFVSHSHDDHYSHVIHRWRKLAPGILYVFGWDAGHGANRLQLAARADTTVDSLRIRTVASTDTGVGFLVSVDGLTLFHAGDHAEWSESESVAYRREIDWLAGFGERVDLAFLPIATGYTCEPLQDIRVGATYAVTRLWPAVTFPMHVPCVDKLDLYRAFAEAVGPFAVRGTIQYAQRLGEGFRYDPLARRATRLPDPSTDAAVGR